MIETYQIAIFYNGAVFTYYCKSSLVNFAKSICAEEVPKEGYFTLETTNEYNQNCVLHLNPRNCGHIEIRKLEAKDE